MDWDEEEEEPEPEDWDEGTDEDWSTEDY